MLKTKDYIESKKKKDYIKNLIASLHEYYSGPKSIIGGIFGKKSKLSKDNAYIGLLLLDSVSSAKANNNARFWYKHLIYQDSKRFKTLWGMGKPKGFWDGERFELLQFLFGDRLANLVKIAWEMIPSFMYQQGHLRRSFRGSDLDAIYFSRQLNFLIEIIYDYEYDMPLEDYVIYNNSISYKDFSLLFAAAIESNDQSIKQLCLDAVYARHEVAKPSRDIIKALLLSNSFECWEAVEKLLLSAQRQEGLRQTILECLDETSLGALKHLIKVILKYKLTRFSSVVRAIDVWAGFGWESERETTVRRFLELADKFLSDPSEIKIGISSTDNAEVYMALWAQGVLDVSQCKTLIEVLLKSSHEKISLALYFISQVNLSTYSIEYGKKYVEHSDTVIACQAVGLLNNEVFVKMLGKDEKANLFSILEEQVPKLPSKGKVSKPRVFSWLTFKYGKEVFLDLMIALIDLNKGKEIEKILPYFDDLSVNHRERVTRLILPDYYTYYYEEPKKHPTLNQTQRAFAFRILKDRSEMIKRTALNALERATLSKEEILTFEGYLVRKSADFRKSVIHLIIKHGNEQVKESAIRLLEAKNVEQRLAGLDLLVWYKNQKPRDNNWLKEQVEKYHSRKSFSSKEEMVLAGLVEHANKNKVYNADNGFGLFEKEKVPNSIELNRKSTDVLRTARKTNRYGLSKPVEKVNKALLNLGELYLKNKEYEYTYEDWNGSMTTGLLGNDFRPIKKSTKGMDTEEVFQNFPLYETWRKWYQDSGFTQRDLFLINLESNISGELGDKEFERFNKKTLQSVFVPDIPKVKEYYWQNPLVSIISSLSTRYPYEGAIDFLSDLLKEIFTSLTSTEASDFKEVKNYWHKEIKTWRDQHLIQNIWIRYSSLKGAMSPEQFNTYWDLTYWRFLTAPKQKEQSKTYIPDLYDYARAYQQKLIGVHELYWRVMQPDSIDTLTQKLKVGEYDIKKEFSFLKEILVNCRTRILEVELLRGDSSTPVTHLAQKINRLHGIDNFIQLLKALGKDTLHKGYISSYGNHEYNKKEILSTLLKRCFPSVDCTQTQFNSAIKKAKITESRLCDAATYSPQWLPLVTSYLGWKDMESAVWWLHAHTNGYHDIQTESEIAKYSSVDITAFRDGAVDIDWFKETYKSLGKAKWEKLYNSAKYISDGGGYRRGLLYADVILGKTKITEIAKRIKEKRNQEYVRVYGVVPLSRKTPRKDVLKRYQFLQNFKKESKKFGAQRQASEAIAIKIALENLARTAGYPDPIRLQWAMETEEAQHIIANAGDIEKDGIVVKLEIDENGKSSIVCLRDGKKLKTMPPKLRKVKELGQLRSFNKTLREQYRRTKRSLESAMINGDLFAKDEIISLMSHPVVSPMLKKLVFYADGNLGFWQDKQLVTPEGNLFQVGANVRIAHCTDLYADKSWSAYQRYCFDNSMTQPFKQIFRELYIPTKDELQARSISRRYAGHQVQPKKTVALLKSQNWTVEYEEGLKKVNHEQNIIARMFALADWFTPADVEAPTLETIEFFDRKDGKRLPLEKVDKRFFSETMRDIDLVVSVAHMGDVDPEASQSSIELRTAIIKETCRLFKIQNVQLSQSHAKIHGDLGEYSVHLGSGVCHKIAGSALSIIPVHSQHRGRMFLPFLDDDPKTAEIMSKVILLAKDNEIKDPTILQQI